MDVSSNAPCTAQPLNQAVSFGEWGLGRISHATKYATPNYGWPAYNYDGYNGYCPTTNPGGTAYIIDSGIQITHPEFEGRASWGWSADPAWAMTDICGHGTHVAGIVAGRPPARRGARAGSLTRTQASATASRRWPR